MARTKNAKTPPQKADWRPADLWAETVRATRKHKVWTVILLCILGYLLFRQVEMRIQKAEFKRAEQMMRAEDARIIDQIGRPQSYDVDTHCYYMKRKFSRGPRECLIRTQMLYRGLSDKEADDMVERVDTMTSSTTADRFKGASAAKGASSTRFQAHKQGDYMLDGCDREYVYWYRSGVSGLEKAGDFRISWVCTGGALAEYYPVK